MWPNARTRLYELLRCYEMKLTHITPASQPQQLTSLASFTCQGRRSAAALAQQTKSDRSSTLLNPDSGKLPQHQLPSPAGSPSHTRSASSHAISSLAGSEDQQGTSDMSLAPEYQAMVHGSGSQSLMVATALALLGRERYFSLEDMRSSQAESRPAHALDPVPLETEHSSLPAPVAQPKPLVLKAVQELQQGRWYGGLEPETAPHSSLPWGEPTWEAATQPAGVGVVDGATCGGLEALTQMAFLDGAVEDRDARRARYAASRGRPWPPVWGSRGHAALTAARRLKALRATSLDASIAVHDSGSAPAQPQTPSASSGSGSAGMCLPPADAHAGTAVTTQPAAAPKPSVGDEVELVCQSLAFGGKGVCKLGGLTVFCARALPGEVLRARIVSVKKAHALAEKLGTVVAHNDAVPARCAHYGQGCGGCALQDLAYAAQLRAKHRQVVDVLQRIGRVADAAALVRPVLAAAQPLAYRNKMTFTFAPESAVPSLAGFGLHAVDNPRKVLPVWECGLQDEGANRILQLLTAALRTREATDALPRLPHRRRAPDGSMEPLVKRVTIRSGRQRGSGQRGHLVILHTGLGKPDQAGSDDWLPEAKVDGAYGSWLAGTGSLEKAPQAPCVAQAAISDRGPKPKALEGVVALLQREVDGLLGIVHQSDRRREPQLLCGEGVLMERLCGLEFLVSPGSFFQTNPVQTQLLYRAVANAVGVSEESDWELQPSAEGQGEPNRAGVVLDLYSGTGTIALSLARAAQIVFGVEANAGAVRDARANATHNAIRNAHFMSADLATPEGVAAVARRVPRPDTVIADPARAGLGAPVVEYLLGCGARTLVYVSCNPATQARDLAALCGGECAPFVLDYVQPVDMFPQTEHIESVAVLRAGA